MGASGLMRRLGRLLPVALAIALGFIGGAAYQSVGAPTATTFYACLKSGTLSDVSTQAAPQCKNSSTLVSWQSFDGAGLDAAYVNEGQAGSVTQPMLSASVQQQLKCGQYPRYSVDLSGCDLSYAQLRQVYLDHANLSGTNLSYSELGRSADGFESSLYEVNLANANLTHTDLQGAALPGSNLSGVQAQYVQLSNTALESSNLSGADLSHANLGGANLGDGYSSPTFPPDPNQTNVVSDLSNANLSGAYLGGAYLGYAKLTGANLTGAEMGGADIRGVDFTNANLDGATNFGSTAYAASAIWSNTTCPDGSNSDDDGGTCVGHG